MTKAVTHCDHCGKSETEISISRFYVVVGSQEAPNGAERLTKAIDLCHTAMAVIVDDEVIKHFAMHHPNGEKFIRQWMRVK
jgi:hypothetical protein